MTPLERAARAAFDEIERQAASLAPEHSGNGYVMPDEFGNRSYYACIDHNIDLMAVARAVLMSVRDADGRSLRKKVRETESWLTAREGFTAMIDAILADGGE